MQRIRSFLVRLALVAAVVSVGCPAAAQQLRIVGQNNSEQEVRGVLEKGQQLRQQRRWNELVSHYDRALQEQPDSETLRQRLDWARTYQDVARRYADPSFVQSAAAISDREAIDLYSELLAKIQSHYVDSPNWEHLVRRGLMSLQVTLGDAQVQPVLAAGVGGDRFAAVQRELAQHMSGRAVRTVKDAREAAWFAAQLAAQRLGMRPAAGILEFVAGATAGLDNYSSFLTPAQLDEVFSQIEGNFVGLGIELETTADTLRIVNVIPGGPAAEAGVSAGDEIIEVGRRSVAELTSETAANLLRGEAGTVVEIGIARPGRPVQRLRVARRLVEVPSVVDVKLVDPTNGVGYLKLTSFQKTTSRDVDDALWKLHRQGMRTLIMDLRGNPGGLLDASVQVADKFLQSGSIVSTRGRTEKFEFNSHEIGTWRVPLVVLIDGDSASASEIFAGAIRDHQRGAIVGVRSYGKGSVQGIFPLAYGKTGVRLTTAKFYSPSGRAISKNGVLPNVTVQVTAKPPVTTGPEPQHDAALASAVDQALRQAGILPRAKTLSAAR